MTTSVRSDKREPAKRTSLEAWKQKFTIHPSYLSRITFSPLYLRRFQISVVSTVIGGKFSTSSPNWMTSSFSAFQQTVFWSDTPNKSPVTRIKCFCKPQICYRCMFHTDHFNMYKHKHSSEVENSATAANSKANMLGHFQLCLLWKNNFFLKTRWGISKPSGWHFEKKIVFKQNNHWGHCTWSSRWYFRILWTGFSRYEPKGRERFRAACRSLKNLAKVLLLMQSVSAATELEDSRSLY